MGFTTKPAGAGTDPIYLSVDFRTPVDGGPGSFFFFIDEGGSLEGYGCRSNGYGSFGLIHPDRYPAETQTRRLHAMAEQIGITPADFINVYRYVGRLALADATRSGRTVLIGDAARTTDPTSSSGLNTAIKDAVDVASAIGAGAAPDALADLDRRIASNTRETFGHALYFQSLIAWGNHTLKRLWGLAPVGRRSSDGWSVHDGFFWLGSWLPRGLQARVTTLVLRVARGPNRARGVLAAEIAALPTHAPTLTCGQTLETDARPR